MSKFRFVTLALSATLMFGSVASAASFSDMPTDPAAAAVIENAVANGILSGTSDGTVKPDAYITRAEMASIITRACGATEEGDLLSFTDVDKNKWYYSAVSKAYAMGALSGSNGKMSPENNITFQECFTVLSQVFDLVPEYILVKSVSELPPNTVLAGRRLYDLSVLSKFDDGQDVADWAKIFVAGVVSHGGWNGVDNKLTPQSYITRLQFATVMDNLFKNYIDKPGTYKTLPEGNTLIRCDGVVLDGVKTEDDIYVADGVSPNGIEVNNANILGRFIVRGCATPYIDENDGVRAGDTGIVLTGHFNSVRIIRPYINLYMGNATYKRNSLYVVQDSEITASQSLMVE